MKGRRLAVFGGALLLAACSADKLTVPNKNSPTPGSVPPQSAVGLQVAGVLFASRAYADNVVMDFGILGRESYFMFPTDSRYTSGYLGFAANGSTGGLDRGAAFGRGATVWSSGYTQRRNLHELKRTAEAPVFSAEEAAGIRGFANTMDALQMLYIVMSRDSIGAPVEMSDDPRAVMPFVSRDSVYGWIVGMLDSAAADLDRAGEAFIFEDYLHEGFGATVAGASFDTPADFRTFNRAIAARALVYHATLGCGDACYTAALAALDESFISEAPADFDDGPKHVFSAQAGDQENLLNASVDPNQLAHPMQRDSVQFKVDGTTPDDRYTAKIRLLAAERCPSTDVTIGICTDYGFQIYPTRSAPMHIIRAEELVLLRAEARWFTGATALAIADLNLVRTNSGGLAPLAAIATDDQFLDALLYEKRYSLMWEGLKWVDYRRFGRLSDLPLDMPTHFRAPVQPTLSEECDYRSQLAAEYHAPDC